jgi:hypothetical protein
MCSAVRLYCRDAAAAAHTRVERRRRAGGWCLEAEGEGPRGLGGGWRGGAHVVCGVKLGTLGDEVLEAVEVAVVSRPHEGRPAELRRRGGGATRGERRRRGAGQQRRRAAR